VGQLPISPPIPAFAAAQVYQRDVRSGSVKRVASAVGEGAMAVQFVHEYLKEM
jgi:thioredoxin reductase